MPAHASRTDRRRLLAASLILGGAPNSARAADALPVIRYGGDAAFPPFESVDAEGKPRGFQIDLLNELGRVMKVRFTIVLQPWAQTETAFQRGSLDMLAMVVTVQRRGWAQFARGHATPAFAVYHLRSQPERQSLQDLAGQRIAVLDSEAMRDTLATWLAGMPVPFVRVADAADALAAVQQGRADAALLPKFFAEPLLASGAAPEVVASRSMANMKLQTYAFAVAPGNAALHAQLETGLAELERSGRLEALRTKWLTSHRDLAARAALEQGLTRQRGWTWGLGAASAATLLLMGAGLWRRGRRIGVERQRRLSAEGELQRAEAMLERSFTQKLEPMLIVDRGSGVVRDANAALLSLLGVAAPALIGQPLGALAQHIDAAALAQLVASLDSEGALVATPLRLRRADGRERDCLVSADRLGIDDAVNVFCIVRDITEQLDSDAALRSGYDALAAQLERARRELAAAREGQVRAEGLLHDFTRSVAHDLRTPLHAVQGFSGLLRERLLSGNVKDALVYSEHIERAAQRMNAMIAGLTRLAQVGRHDLQRQRVDMKRLADEAWALLASSQPAGHVTLRIGVLPDAQAEPDLAAQVWQNLLDNARKYSARVADARIAVDSFRDERGTWYRVTDNGAGFDMADARRLFQPFQRLHSAQQFEGSGIGLSLVRRIVDHHGGEIRLRSTPGVGTVAEFTLEAAPAALR